MAKRICRLSTYEGCSEFYAQVLHAALTHLHMVLSQATLHTELMILLKIIYKIHTNIGIAEHLAFFS